MNEASSRNTALSAALVALGLAVILFARLGSFGIWDPWELSAADVARDLLSGEAHGARTTPILTSWLVARGFGLFGVEEWAGRAPIALCGALGLLVVAFGVRRAVDTRAGIIAALVVGTTPIYLLHAREMLGWAPAMAAGGLVFFSALELVAASDDEAGAARSRIVAAIGLAAGVALSILAAGFMLGALPALLGVGVAVVARAEPLSGMDAARRGTSVGMVALAVVGAVVTLLAVQANAEGYSSVLGGAPRGGTPPTFEVALEQIFHGLAPWIGLVPVAFGQVVSRERTLAADAPSRRKELLELAAPAWAAFAFAAQTVYCARYGQAPFLAVLAIGASVAVCLRELETTGRGSWAAGIVVFLLTMLALRDFAGYPVSPADGLALTDVTAPEVFHPTRWWAATLLPFALFAFFGLARDASEPQDRFLADAGMVNGRWDARDAWHLAIPVELVREQARKGRSFLAWLGFFALLLTSVVVYGILCLALGEETRPQPIVAAITGPLALVAVLARFVLRRRVTAAWLPWATWGVACVLMAVTIAVGVLSLPGLSSLAIRVGRYLFAVPIAVVLGIGIFRGARHGFHILRENALVPMLVSGFVVGAYASLGWTYELSEHFSPREVYDTYNALAVGSEAGPLGEYRVSGRAAAYYTSGEIAELENEADALEFLGRDERVWLVLRTDDLAQLDRSWRGRSGHHLFVADARSARVVLATNRAIEARADQNFLAEAILDEAPTPEHVVGASFDRRIELVGYDLEMPGGDRIGPGQRMTITWYWRCLAPVPGSYQIFLHGDGMGQRLNGDHEPVDGRYPVRLWSEGDIVVDRQEVTVPANFPPGTYTLYIGFYSGESRLEVVEGPEDDANRAIAGTFEVR